MLQKKHVNLCVCVLNIIVRRIGLSTQKYTDSIMTNNRFLKVNRKLFSTE